MPTPSAAPWSFDGHSARSLVAVEVAAGTAGVARLLAALSSALDGSGPAIAPIPALSTSVSARYRFAIERAVRADDLTVPLESSDVAVVMATSGSTGSPRGVLLTSGQLCAMTAVVNGLRASSATPVWVLALPVTSIGGVNVLVRALATGIDPVVLPSVGGATTFTAELFVDAVNAARSRSSDIRVSLVPVQVARILDDPAATAALRECSLVLVGGAPLRPALRAVAAASGIDLVTTYGATETSGGCVFGGVPLPGVSVASRTPDAGGAGRLMISGPCVALGYRHDPALTAAAFVDGWYVTSDMGVVDEQGRVEVIGRIDDVVVVNGINVSPDAVERTLEAIAGITAAAVVVTTSRAGEPRLHAFVQTNAQITQDAVVAEVAGELGVAARPRTVREVAALPYLPNGKVDRLLLAQWAEDGRG